MVMKNIVVVLAVFTFVLTLTSCDNITNSEREDDGYETAMEQLEEEGKVSKSRRIELVREVIKANEDYTEVDIDKEKIGLE